jgi:GrpB-like predicted nucleotidyltransferase (UPF0157 family)/RimJ/RimL family protein N-acetyltransferase
MSVTVEQYNPEWPRLFEELKSELEGYLQGVNYISIEHVGSTSVPGLAAKPIIDCDIITTSENVRPAIDAIVTNGNYSYLGELGIVGRHVIKGPNHQLRRNIYVCPEGIAQTRNHLGLRDTLRANPELREEYARMKLDLAAAGTNIIDYVEAKGVVIQKILKASGRLTPEELEDLAKANIKGEQWGAVKAKRLLLRSWVMRDIDGYYELESNEENARYQAWPPRTMEQAREQVIANMKDSIAKPRMKWEMVVESEGRLIGRVGAALTPLETDDPVKPKKHFDLWFSFLPEFQGKGYATEAMTTFIDELVKRQGGGPMELEIECDPRNTGSWKLAERLGFEKHSLTKNVQEIKGEWVDSLVYRKTVGI